MGVLGSRPSTNILADIPAAYFGFHFMLPFQFHDALTGTDIVEELRAIFGPPPNDVGAIRRHLKSQARYAKVILKMESLCKKYAQMDLQSPHPIFVIDKTFCATLRPRMLHMYDFLCFYLPDTRIFKRLTDPQKDILKFESMLIEAFSATLLAMEFSFIYADTNTHNQTEGVARTGALLALSDIADTVENKLNDSTCVSGCRAFLEMFMSAYLTYIVKPIPYTIGQVNSPPSEDLMSERQIEQFQECRFTHGLSMSECCAQVIDYGVSKIFHVIQLINRYNLFQPRVSHSSQRFRMYLLKGLIKEVNLSDRLPKTIKAAIEKHLLAKVPLMRYPRREDALGFRLKASQMILPDIFDIYLRRHHPTRHNRFLMYQLIAETGMYLDSKTEPLVSPTPELSEFTELYNNLISRLFAKKIVFYSLYQRHSSIRLALSSLVKELAAYNGTEKIIESIKHLIKYYVKANVLDAKDAETLNHKISVFFHPQYLLASSDV